MVHRSFQLPAILHSCSCSRSHSCDVITLARSRHQGQFTLHSRSQHHADEWYSTNQVRRKLLGRSNDVENAPGYIGEGKRMRCASGRIRSRIWMGIWLRFLFRDQVCLSTIYCASPGLDKVSLTPHARGSGMDEWESAVFDPRCGRERNIICEHSGSMEY